MNIIKKNLIDESEYWNNFLYDVIPINKKGSKIKIKKQNKGKFTDYCGGKVTQECINRGKNSSSATIRKRATFADNARKWTKKHQEGGPIFFEDGTLNPESLYTQSRKHVKDPQELTPGQRGMIKARMALDSHFGNKTARRMTNYDTRSFIFPQYIIPADPIEGPARGNVFMGSVDNYAVPGIKENDKWELYLEPDLMARPEQNIRFETPRDADIFSRYYKQFAPMMYLWDGPLMYNK